MSSPESGRDAGTWASMGQLRAVNAPSGAVDGHLDGRRVTSPVQGFGKLWQKTYRARLHGSTLSPSELITLWKAEFATFWPPGRRFYASADMIGPGDTALLNIGLGRATMMSTGILVLHADEDTFTFMTPEGHGLAGWITFSATEDDGVTVATISLLVRAGDPLYELILPFGGHRMEDRMWLRTLDALAARAGSRAPEITMTKVCVDRRRQWVNVRNLRANALVRTIAGQIMRPRRSHGIDERG